MNVYVPQEKKHVHDILGRVAGLTGTASKNGGR